MRDSRKFMLIVAVIFILESIGVGCAIYADASTREQLGAPKLQEAK